MLIFCYAGRHELGDMLVAGEMMPYNIAWYIENRVMLIEVKGTIALAEFEQLHQEAFAYVAQSPHKVHAIADVSQFTATSTNLRLLTAATNKEQDDKQGMTILVAPNMPHMLHFMASIVLQTLRLEYRVCHTMAQALTILSRIDADLAHLSAP